MGATPTENALIVGDLAGDPGYTELTPETGWSRSSGFFTTRKFVGTRDGITTLANTFAIANSGVDQITPTFDGLKGELTVRIVDGTDSQGLPGKEMPVWECTENALVKPIEAHPLFAGCLPLDMQFARECFERAWSIGRLANVDETTKAALSAPFNKAYSSDNIEVVVGPPFAITFVDVGPDANLLSYFNLLWKGTTDYFDSGFNLTKTTTVSLRSVLKAIYTGVNQVVSLATIDPPTALLGALSDLPYADGGHGQWEWLKRAPQVRSKEKGMYEIVYSFWGAERWSSALYNGTAIP
jgi:hypothetical protein